MSFWGTPGMVINTHVCRGNFHSTYANSGAYDPVADILFGEENVNAYYRDRQQADRGRAVAKLRLVKEIAETVWGVFLHSPSPYRLLGRVLLY